MILITGCNSLLGKTLLKKLADTGEKIKGLDIYREQELPANAEFIQGDLLSKKSLLKACEGVDTVYHLFEVRSPGQAGRRFMKKVNVSGTENLLACAKAAGIKKIIALSSYAVYGTMKKVPAGPDSGLKPNTAYGKDKLRAEKILTAHSAGKLPNITIIRPAMIIGPGTRNPAVLITLYMAMRMGSDNVWHLAGNGETRFQLLHPEDAAEAFIAAASSGNAGGKIYNAGSDMVPTQIEQAMELKKMPGMDFKIKRIGPLKARLLSLLLRPMKSAYLSGEHLIYLLGNMSMNCSAAGEKLGWRPSRTNTDILRETAEWYRVNKK